MNSVVAPRSARPLYEVFLERVIKIDEVQRHRAQATDEHAERFFTEGRLLGDLDDYRWALDEPQIFSSAGVQILGILGPYGLSPISTEPKLSPAMQAAWAAAGPLWATLVAELRGGAHVVRASHPVTGERRELDPAELLLPGLVADVRAGCLLRKGSGGNLAEQWIAIELRPVAPEQAPGQMPWNDFWKHEKGRREGGKLPDKKAYLRQAVDLIKELYGRVTVSESGLRLFKAALYRGDTERRPPSARPRKSPTVVRRRTPPTGFVRRANNNEHKKT